MEIIEKQNICAAFPERSVKEVFQTLLEDECFKLERIVSSGQVTPEGTWLEEPDDEWVMVIKGRARLQFRHQEHLVELCAGDFLLIPARCAHRVAFTDPSSATIWLALHFRHTARKQPGEETVIRDVKVIRTRKRRKTTTARIEKGTMYVRVPAHMSDESLKKTIEDFKRRFDSWMLKKRLARQEDLFAVARRLHKKYLSGRFELRSIEYVTDQYRKYGCCDFRKKAIRISHRLASVPLWVRDYVIIHELAHLQQPHHRRPFWDLVCRYPFTERARGYLCALGFETEE